MARKSFNIVGIAVVAVLLVVGIGVGVSARARASTQSQLDKAIRQQSVFTVIRLELVDPKACGNSPSCWFDRIGRANPPDEVRLTLRGFDGPLTLTSEHPEFSWAAMLQPGDEIRFYRPTTAQGSDAWANVRFTLTDHHP